jgi:N-acetylmuramoyl-L-alanine amidase
MKIIKQKRHRYYLSRTVSVLVIIVLFLTIPYFIFPPGSVFAAENSAIVICINPGHGGRDHGATGPSGLKEKDVNLDIAFRLREKLAGAGFKVILTREDDTKKSLDEIVNFVNASNADIFVSVHNNSHTDRSKNGTETFYYSQSSVGRILAGCINSRVVEQIGTLNRGVKAAEFTEIKGAKMVSALIEGAFISNPDEEAKLNDAGFRDKIATGIYNGILEYLKVNAGNISASKKLYSAQSFVRRVYNKGLNIEPDGATLSSWADRLSSGTVSHADFIRNLLSSSQMNARNLTDSQYVDVLYNAILDRSPDSAGKSFWSTQVKVIGRLAVLNQFLSSVEFNGLLKGYSIYGYVYAGSLGTATFNTGNTTTAANALNISFLNGVGIKGIAAKTSGLFRNLKDPEGRNKYNIYVVADAPNYNYINTQIICKSEKEEIKQAAEEIKSMLGAGTITKQNGAGQVSDVVIIIGRDLLTSAGFNNSTGNAGSSNGLIVVNILNGQGTYGIAARTKNSIEAAFNKSGAAIRVKETKNADSFSYKKTRILIFTDTKAAEETAVQLQNFLGTGEIVKSGSNPDNVDIAIILGSDYKK